MKVSKIIQPLMAATLFFATISTLYAQNKAQFLVAKFVSNGLSPTIIQTIKLQVSDPIEQNKILKDISDYKFYYVLVYNVDDGTSNYYLESLNKVSGISPAGNSEFVIFDKSGSFKGKECFTGDEYYFSGNKKSLKWDISREKKKIGKYNCTKATLKNLSGAIVWFTTEIPVATGPDIYQGLPGFVLEVETTFEKTDLLSVSFTDSLSKTDQDKFKTDFYKNKALSIDQVFNSKNNFIQMVKKQLNTGKK